MPIHRELKRAGYFPRASKKGDGAGDEDARTRVEKEDVPVPVDEQGVVRCRPTACRVHSYRKLVCLSIFRPSPIPETCHPCSHQPIQFAHTQPKGISRWPPILRYVASAAGLDKEAAAGSPPPNAQLALTALGGVSWQLRRSMIDMDLLSMQVRLGLVGWLDIVA